MIASVSIMGVSSLSAKPKVAAMNEYIYKNIRESDYKVNRPGKPKKIYKQQVAQRTNLKVYKASPAELARSKYKGPKFSKVFVVLKCSI